jgi:ADP-heptose:LPS heptosyltransferase
MQPLKNSIRWTIKRALRISGNILRKNTGFPCPVRSPLSIAYVAAGGIGDIIMAWQAINLLKRSFPDSRLTLFVSPKPYAVIKAAFTDIDVSEYRSTSIVTGFKCRGFDIAASNILAAFYMSAEFNAFNMAKVSYGFRYPDEADGSGRFFNDSLPINENTHDIEQNLRLVSLMLGIPFSDDTHLFPARDSKIPADAPVVIHPGVETGYEYKMWPHDRYAALCAKLVSAGRGVKIILGPSDYALADYYSSEIPQARIERPSAQELLEEIRKAALFVGNDSGPAHLAAFFGTPGITLIGPVDAKRTEPRGKNSVTIQNRVDCSPCFFKKQNCADNKCMKSITVEQVWKAAERFLTV